MGKGYEFKIQYINQIHIPEVSEEKQNIFETIANNIIDIKKNNPKADTTDLEHEIERMIYDLYDLTDDEIKIIEKDL
ncbi:hypothetical protein [Flexistipes sp.]|uniref:hypothetical protein n=1 Tax=Flexistipes sp. TaxID=3088135 RepID=UPI002E1FD484|nr:hypothetical protein [Flexistipes sp.]